ncbi:MAG: hypothetical protein AAFX85_20185, partial [Pseudomonadota bacterium]
MERQLVGRIGIAIAALGSLVLGACSEPAGTTASTAAEPDLAVLAREYVTLELAMGRHDTAHVDAYFGPEELSALAEQAALTPAQIVAQAQALAQRITPYGEVEDEWQAARVRGLLARLEALATRARMAQGERLSFDEEARALFGVTPPQFDAAHFDALLVDIDALLPGDEPLATRVSAFVERFVVPPEKLSAVFQAAIDECRARTLAHIQLPAEERFTLEYVSNKPWGGYNW